MVIKTDKEYREYMKMINQITEKGTKLGDMELLPEEDKAEYTRLANAVCDWEEVHYPISNLSKIAFAHEMNERMKEKHLNQRETARLMGVQESRISELLSGKRRLTLKLAKKLRDVLGMPADMLLDMA